MLFLCLLSKGTIIYVVWINFILIDVIQIQFRRNFNTWTLTVTNLITFQCTWIFLWQKKVTTKRLSGIKNMLNYDKILLEKWYGNRSSEKKNEEFLTVKMSLSVYFNMSYGGNQMDTLQRLVKFSVNYIFYN